MAHGDRAAEQAEKDQPSTCLRPDGASPELPSLRDREDFLERVDAVTDSWRMHQAMLLDGPQFTDKPDKSYHGEMVRKAESLLDQLTLMSAAQILEEAEHRRREVMEKFGKARRLRREEIAGDWPERYSEIVLDADERRGD